jgi:glycosyltransferase involved in cell wall biosynthesis
MGVFGISGLVQKKHREMIRVLRIINRFNLGGPTYHVSLLTRFMDEEFETRLIGGVAETKEADSLHIPDDLGINYELIPEMSRSIQPWKDFMAYRKIRKIIREYRPHIVHTHASKAGFLGRFAALHEKVPVKVHTFHGHVFSGYFGKFKTGIYKTLERYLADKTDSIIALSQLQKVELSEKHKICPPEKITIIPLGFNLDKFREGREEKREAFRKKIKAGEKTKVVSIVGRLVPIKNHRLFLEAFSICVKKSEGNVMACIVGDGALRKELESYTSALGLSFSEVHFLSWIKNVDEVYAGSDLVVLCSDNEGTPVSLIEAQASGVPVVATEVGGVKDILEPGGGTLVPPGNPEQLSAAILNQISGRTEANGVSEKIMQKFDYKRLASDMKQHYRALVSPKIS